MNPMGRGNFARCVETISLPTIDVTQPAPDVVTIYTIDIASFPRAQQIAANYQFYRPKYVKFVYEPLYSLGSTANTIAVTPLPQKMNFYYMMNRQGNVPNPGTGTLPWLLEQGAKPIPFGDSRAKNITVKYRPNLLSAYSQNAISMDNAGPSTGLPIYNKWVNTYEQVGAVNTQNLTQDWNGHFVIIEPSNLANFNVAGNTPVANVKQTVEWEFKNPYKEVVAAPTQTTLTEAKRAKAVPIVYT